MKIPNPRSEIQNLAPVHHGAFDFVELATMDLPPDQVLDFSVNSNPFGPSPAVYRAIRQTPVDRYPDREAIALRTALAAELSVGVDQIVVGNGTSELLSLVALAFVRPDDLALILAPTYGEYVRAVTMMGGVVETIWGREGHHFRHDPQEVGDWLRNRSPRLVFVCNPNNPTGGVVPLDVLAAWVRENPDTLFVVDEAYLKFVPGLESVLTIGAPNLLVLASLTKDYALAGLRLGYAAGHPRVVDALARVRPPWNVNALALSAGLAALQDVAYLHGTLARLRSVRDELFGSLQAFGYALIPSETHYCLVDVGEGAKFRKKLLEHNLQVRDCASFGLPAFVRIATKKPGENACLLAVFQELKS